MPWTVTGTTLCLAAAACSQGTNSPTSTGGNVGVEASGGDSTAAAVGGTSSGGASAAGGTVGGGGTEGGTGGETHTGGDAATGGAAPLVGEPHVFVGSTGGTVRAYLMDQDTGELTAAGEVTTSSLDFLAVAPATNTVFVSANDLVEAYGYDPAADSFTPAGSKTTHGNGTHVAVDASGSYVFVAHYSQNALSFLSYSEQEGFGSAEKFSPGDKAHMVELGPDGRTVFVPALGANHVAQYDLNTDMGELAAADPANTGSPGGPRHMDFHPDGAVAYVLAELESDIHVYDVDPTTGLLSRRTDASVATHADGQGHQSSDIKVRPDGRHLYAVNRQPDEVVHFEIESGGGLVRKNSYDLSAEVRAFGMDPAGKFLQVGDKGGTLTTFSIDDTSGALSEEASLEDLGTINVTAIHYLQP